MHFQQNQTRELNPWFSDSLKRFEEKLSNLQIKIT